MTEWRKRKTETRGRAYVDLFLADTLCHFSKSWPFTRDPTTQIPCFMLLSLLKWSQTYVFITSGVHLVYMCVFLTARLFLDGPTPRHFFFKLVYKNWRSWTRGHICRHRTRYTTTCNPLKVCRELMHPNGKLGLTSVEYWCGFAVISFFLFSKRLTGDNQNTINCKLPCGFMLSFSESHVFSEWTQAQVWAANVA